jgi:ABC-2 type transport system ATP-binding protein
MSGLDPLGRRHVRQLMLRLRDRGCTVFFSSHILADAESLCSRVAILAQGKLVAAGRLSEILAFELRGWELVVANLSDELRASLAPRARAMTALAHGRFTVELPPEETPEEVLHELAQGGAQLVSLNPVRETLEDYFVQSVGAAASRHTGL